VNCANNFDFGATLFPQREKKAQAKAKAIGEKALMGNLLQLQQRTMSETSRSYNGYYAYNDY